jgi:hypothetical protein
VDFKSANTKNKPSARLSRPYEDQSPLWEAVGYDPLVSPIGAGATTKRMYNNHDSLVAPLQPVALDAPMSPARDFVIPTISELEHMASPESPGSIMGDDWRDDILSSNQPTPTWYHHEGDSMPDGLITDWTIESVASWVSSLGHGFIQYHDYFIGQ